MVAYYYEHVVAHFELLRRLIFNYNKLVFHYIINLKLIMTSTVNYNQLTLQSKCFDCNQIAQRCLLLVNLYLIKINNRCPSCRSTISVHHLITHFSQQWIRKPSIPSLNSGSEAESFATR